MFYEINDILWLVSVTKLPKMVSLVEVTNIRNIYTIRKGARNISIKSVKLQFTILKSFRLLLILDETMLSTMTSPNPRRELKNKSK